MGRCREAPAGCAAVVASISLVSAVSETTGKSVAKIAARGIKNPAKLSHDEIQAVCASALTQVDAEKRMARLKIALERQLLFAGKLGTFTQDMLDLLENK